MPWSWSIVGAAAAVVAAATGSAVLAGCSSAGSCTDEVPCPTSPVATAPGDYRVVLAATSVMTVDPATLPVRGDLIFSAPVCPSSSTTDGCVVTLRELAIEFDRLPVVTLVGTLNADIGHMWIDTPVQMERTGTAYGVPAGTVVHTCALVNGRRWHGRAQTGSDLTLSLTVPTQTMSVEGTLPVTLRAGDANCSEFLLLGNVVATAATPWARVPGSSDIDAAADQ